MFSDSALCRPRARQGPRLLADGASSRSPSASAPTPRSSRSCNSVLLQPLPVPHAGQLAPHVQRLPGRRARRRRGVDRRARLLRPAARDRRLPGAGAVQHARHDAQRQRRSAAHPLDDRHAVAAAAAAGAADPRPFLHRGRRGSSARPHKVDPHVRLVAAVVRRPGSAPSAAICGSTASPSPWSASCRSGFSFLDPDVKVWLPLAFTAEKKSDDSRHSNNWSYIARLKPGATDRTGAAANRRAEHAQSRSLPQAQSRS